jgi:hypothetical protein
MPLDVARMWHEIRVSCNHWGMDDPSLPTDWEMWQTNPTWKKLLAIFLFAVIPTWLFPPFIFLVVGWFIYKRREHKRIVSERES